MASCASRFLGPAHTLPRVAALDIIVVRMIFMLFQVTVSTFFPANVGSCFLLRLSLLLYQLRFASQGPHPCVAECRPVLNWVQAP